MAATATRSAARRPIALPQRPVTARRRAAIGALLVAALLSTVVLVAGASLLAYHGTHSSEVFAGTSAAGIELGGKTKPEAQALLDAKFNAYLQSPIELSANGTTIHATPAELGVRFDSAAMVDHAYAFGRGSTLWRDTRDWLDALAGGHDVATVVTVDRATFSAFLDQQLGGVLTPPTDASFVRGNDGHTILNPGTPGLGVDLEATYQAFEREVPELSTAPVQIATVQVQPSVGASDLQPAVQQADMLTGAPLDLTLDGTTWEISANDLMAMMQVQRSSDGPSVSLDRDLVRRYIASLEQQAYTSGTNATIVNDNGTFKTTPAQFGHKLDIEASTDAALAALQQGQREITLVTKPVLPQINDDAVQAALAEAQRVSASAITITWDGGSATLNNTKIAQAVTFDTDASRNPAIAVKLDEASLKASTEQMLAPVAKQVHVDAVDAHLRWYNGQVQVQTPEQLGRDLDVDATVMQVIQAAKTGTKEVGVLVKDVKPQVTADMAGSIQIQGKFGDAWTPYGDSSANRFHNVELAASRVNGELIPPGGTFSFNRAVGPVNFDSGYKTGFGIIATNGDITTIPSVGGGICQVATTVFQAAFRAGMPIVERNWHLYWIERYGSSPSGAQGLDATVDPDYDLDFSFKNATNNWLAVVFWYDGSNVHAELWGSNPGWQVQVDPPVITNVVPTTQEMHYETSDEIPAGTTILVEHAQDGFDAAIHRVVRDASGNVIDEVTLNSTYAPAYNTTLNGTGSGQ